MEAAMRLSLAAALLAFLFVAPASAADLCPGGASGSRPMCFQADAPVTLAVLRKSRRGNKCGCTGSHSQRPYWECYCDCIADAGFPCYVRRTQGKYWCACM
jgi:hypothetical protein